MHLNVFSEVKNNQKKIYKLQADPESVNAEAIGDDASLHVWTFEKAAKRCSSLSFTFTTPRAPGRKNPEARKNST